jgi:hypothetical protein
VGDAGAALDVSCSTCAQLGHARGAAGAAQFAVLVHGHAAGVIAAVFQALQAFDQDGNDVAGADGADDATHEISPRGGWNWRHGRQTRRLGCLQITKFNLK